MWKRLKAWWQEQKNYAVCERIEKGYDCKNRKCLGREPH